MENILKPQKRHAQFTWDGLGEINKGRAELGDQMPVLVYRLMQYTMLDVLTEGLGFERARAFFRRSGYRAGIEFAKNTLELYAGQDAFVASLQQQMRELKIGILRMEVFDEATGEITLTVSEDLDCSGLPITNETVCYYDEGFISGIFEAYTGKKYDVREIDCWANGDITCRFNGKVI